MNINIGIVSGYFNPITDGHIEYFMAAQNHIAHIEGDYFVLVAIINNDIQVKLKKSIPFMTEKSREKILNSIVHIDEVIISCDEDSTVCRTLRHIFELYTKDYGQNTAFFFINSGDRNASTSNSAESAVCKELGIEEVFLNLPKINSSSKLIRDAVNWYNRHSILRKTLES